MDIASVEREGDNAPQGRHQGEEMLALMNSLPAGKDNVPVGQQMTPAQALEFAKLSSQIRIHGYNHLAESRLQRDARVMGYAADAIDKLRAGDANLKGKYDQAGDGAGLVGLLRKAAEGLNEDPQQPADTKTCSLDLALFLKEQAALSSMKKILALKEADEMTALAAKYNVKGTLDPEKLPSPDREKAIWLLKAVGYPATREFQAAQDWENLRRFARVSMLRYSLLRDAIIAGAGAEDYDYDKTLKQAYDADDAVTKLTMDAWSIIDQNIPSEASKEAAQRAKIIKDSANKPK
jgi:hypothetical protein